MPQPGAVPRRHTGRAPSVGALTGLLVAIACGSNGSPGGPTTPSSTKTITITAAGVTPKNVEVTLGERVRFVNNDSRSHNIGSDPHPEHTDCPDINQVGFLSPGQSRETGNFVTTRVCGFHDHDNPDNQSLRGTITTR